ncbi:hypothetical protein Glove_52g147 [Diversispora epigaea]|uniref:BTB domain-containing protein n=1 Tax=Diversispora epigaea TaxID=1348612 RepID=A0A397JDD1_9GLOM|nr:hypothetical protein Glove_52g147 [Diversispora epigaea]
MTFKFFEKLSQDFSELLNDKKEYNVVIEVDKEGNKKSFTAHSVVLRYRSSYFDKELENVTTNKNHVKTIIKPNISAQIFEVILNYVYELSIKLESYLIESKASWLRAHFFLIYHSIFDSNDFESLKNFYNDIIAKYPNLIFESGDFTSLQETALISILKRDDLNIEEIKIWDYVIKWGIAQNPTLPTNSEEWTNENFEALKIILQQCLPLIRYFHISSEDIWEKVKSYEKILEKQLWDDMIQHHMFQINLTIFSAPELPPRANEQFSTIINKEHVAELSSWIDRKSTTYSSENIPYEFQLILRGSKDGFNPKTFWNMCNGHAVTIVAVKVAETDEIVGGYNPLAWEIQQVVFIFSLKNGNIQNSILNRVKDDRRALYYRNYNDQNIYRPTFGAGEFGMKSNFSDFTQDKQCICRCDPKYCIFYEKPI